MLTREDEGKPSTVNAETVVYNHDFKYRVILWPETSPPDSNRGVRGIDEVVWRLAACVEGSKNARFNALTVSY